MARGFGGQGRPKWLALCLCLALVAVVFTGLFGSRIRSHYLCWQQGVPAELWHRFLERRREGWQLESWTWTSGPTNGQRSYLLCFRRPFEQFADGLYQTEFRWPTSRGWATWIDDQEPWGLPWSEPRWVDLNGDRRPELVLRFLAGGNGFRGDSLRIFQVRRDHLIALPLPLGECQSVDEIKDLDADGRLELIVLGTELEMFGKRCDADGIAYTRVFRWVPETGEFRDRSHEFPGYYEDQLRQEIEFAREQLNGRRTSGEHPEDRVLHEARVLAATAIHRWCVGQADAGWKQYDEKLAALIAGVGELRAATPPAALDSVDLLAERKQLSQLFFGRELPWSAATLPPTPATARSDPPTATR